MTLTLKEINQRSLEYLRKQEIKHVTLYVNYQECFRCDNRATAHIKACVDWDHEIDLCEACLQEMISEAQNDPKIELTVLDERQAESLGST